MYSLFSKNSEIIVSYALSRALANELYDNYKCLEVSPKIVNTVCL